MKNTVEEHGYMSCQGGILFSGAGSGAGSGGGSGPQADASAATTMARLGLACQVGGGKGKGPGIPGSPTQPNPSPKIGIGIEVPGPDAVQHGVLNLAKDTGHTIAYLKDAQGTIASLLSFGPGDDGITAANANQFLSGRLPGYAHWPITGTLSTWESDITSNQLTQGEQAIANFKAHPPNYTMAFNCTSAALSIAAGIGISLPNGVGPVVYRTYHVTLHNDRVANPYTLSVQMAAQFGNPDHAAAASFPRP